MKPCQNDIREKLADLCHKQWSGWMEYLFSKCKHNKETGEMTIPKWAVERWRRQTQTEYKNLSKEEQDSDRGEADKFIKIIEQEHTK